MEGWALEGDGWVAEGFSCQPCWGKAGRGPALLSEGPGGGSRGGAWEGRGKR